MPKGVSTKTGRSGNYGNRMTVEQRRANRDRQNVIAGKQAGWAEEALDFYLSGFPVDEILAVFDVKVTVFYNCIAKAALYRLMVEHQAQRLEEIPELSAEENK